MQTKIYALLVALLASVAFVGCTSDEEEVTESGALKQLSFSAVADAGNSVTFCSGDAINVFAGTASEGKRFATNDDGASVTFSGAAPESDAYTALYPYQEGARISGSTLSAVLPATQYAQAGTTFDPAAVLSVATTTSEEMEFAFKNVCGLVKFTTTEALAKVVFKGNNGEKVAGNVAITVGNAPTATGDATSITLCPPSPATTFAAGTYYISVLPQAFEKGFTLEAYKTSSSASADYKLEVSKSVKLGRSEILNVGKLSSSPAMKANGHEFVDLGIEVDGKKVLWATMNVGATSPAGYGDYFAWGETTPKSDYSWTTYKWGSYSALTKYDRTDGKAVLELADDAARQNWGGDWVMPTTAELQALYNAEIVEWKWTGNYKSTGVKGYTVTSKSDTSKSIFLPAAGFFGGSSVYDVGSLGYYWSSSLDTDYPAIAYSLYFGSGDVNPAYYYGRCCGRSVRPVLRMASGE